MRPSAINRVNAKRADSRRIASKALTITTPGVSSIITSTPVIFSKARMLRPSRPMTRPFISSFGMSTVLVVDSAVCAAAYRCNAKRSVSRACSSQRSAVFFSCFRISAPCSSISSWSSFFRTISFASSFDRFARSYKTWSCAAIFCSNSAFSSVWRAIFSLSSRRVDSTAFSCFRNSSAC